MAKLHEEVVVLRVSKLIKDKDEDPGILCDIGVLESLEQVAQELLGAGVMIELERE